LINCDGKSDENSGGKSDERGCGAFFYPLIILEVVESLAH
jgi:hypothetical protein